MNNLKKQPSKYWRLIRERGENFSNMERSAYPSLGRSWVTKKCKLEIFLRHTITNVVKNEKQGESSEKETSYNSKKIP